MTTTKPTTSPPEWDGGSSEWRDAYNEWYVARMNATPAEEKVHAGCDHANGYCQDSTSPLTSA